MRSSLFTFTLTATVAAQGFRPGGIVQTDAGRIVGKASSWKGQVSEYLGVPFAKPPVGTLRWEPPQAFRRASTKFINATNYGLSCAESASWASRANPNAPNNIGQSENEQSEDCLSLNIWTKPQTGERKKAVMVSSVGVFLKMAATDIWR